VRLHLYLLRLLLVAFAFTFGGMVVLSLPGVAVAAVHKLRGFPLLAVLEWVPLVLAGLVPYMLPLAFLFSVVAVYGRLAADNEWTSIRMSGRHPLQVVLTGLGVALVLQATTLVFVSDLLPWIRREQSSFLARAASQTIRELSPGRTELELGDFYLTARRRDGQAFLDAFLHLPAEEGKPAQTLRAERVRFRFEKDQILLELTDARTVVEDREIRSGNPVVRIDTALLRSERESDMRKLKFLSNEQIVAEADEPRHADLRVPLPTWARGKLSGLLATRHPHGLAAAAWKPVAASGCCCAVGLVVLFAVPTPLARVGAVAHLATA
jgi:lipopolysaccharide export system permease protein